MVTSLTFQVGVKMTLTVVGMQDLHSAPLSKSKHTTTSLQTTAMSLEDGQQLVLMIRIGIIS